MGDTVLSPKAVVRHQFVLDADGRQVAHVFELLTYDPALLSQGQAGRKPFAVHAMAVYYCVTGGAVVDPDPAFTLSRHYKCVVVEQQDSAQMRTALRMVEALQVKYHGVSNPLAKPMELVTMTLEEWNRDYLKEPTGEAFFLATGIHMYVQAESARPWRIDNKKPRRVSGDRITWAVETQYCQPVVGLFIRWQTHFGECLIPVMLQHSLYSGHRTHCPLLVDDGRTPFGTKATAEAELRDSRWRIGVKPDIYAAIQNPNQCFLDYPGQTLSSSQPELINASGDADYIGPTERKQRLVQYKAHAAAYYKVVTTQDWLDYHDAFIETVTDYILPRPDRYYTPNLANWLVRIALHRPKGALLPFLSGKAGRIRAIGEVAPFGHAAVNWQAIIRNTLQIDMQGVMRRNATSNIPNQAFFKWDIERFGLNPADLDFTYPWLQPGASGQTYGLSHAWSPYIFDQLKTLSGRFWGEFNAPMIPLSCWFRNSDEVAKDYTPHRLWQLLVTDWDAYRKIHFKSIVSRKGADALGQTQA
jgi:hypothetical protein